MEKLKLLVYAIRWISTRVLLSIGFYFFVVPMGMMMKLFRVDPLQLKIDKKATTYWQKKETSARSLFDYNRQF